MGRCVPDGPQADHLDPRGVRAAHLKDQNHSLIAIKKEAADFFQDLRLLSCSDIDGGKFLWLFRGAGLGDVTEQ